VHVRTQEGLFTAFVGAKEYSAAETLAKLLNQTPIFRVHGLFHDLSGSRTLREFPHSKFAAARYGHKN